MIRDLYLHRGVRFDSSRVTILIIYALAVDEYTIVSFLEALFFYSFLGCFLSLSFSISDKSYNASTEREACGQKGERL